MGYNRVAVFSHLPYPIVINRIDQAIAGICESDCESDVRVPVHDLFLMPDGSYSETKTEGGIRVGDKISIEIHIRKRWVSNLSVRVYDGDRDPSTGGTRVEAGGDYATPIYTKMIDKVLDQLMKLEEERFMRQEGDFQI